MRRAVEFEMHHFVFDAYGTLFDLHAAAERYKDAIGPKWQQLSQTWRSKHLEYTWVHSLSGRPTTFWELACRSLDFATAAAGLSVADSVRQNLLAAYRTMKAYPEVAEVLGTLRSRGAKVAILSNGDPDMLEDAVGAAGLADVLDAVLSVSAVGVFKPAPQVYELATTRFACEAADISFQSSNRWDIAGAKAFGFRTVWVNRTGAPNEYPDLQPDRTVRDLRGLLS
ncbi:MAG TPA: haloacid dehalogenase type II [Hyphomicrobiaceae bacterium]|nr:haloacid dehalogenase type II [Hyphomicrobiaceae bacterium]